MSKPAQIISAMQLADDAKFFIKLGITGPYESLPEEALQELRTKLNATVDTWLTNYIHPLTQTPASK